MTSLANGRFSHRRMYRNLHLLSVKKLLTKKKEEFLSKWEQQSQVILSYKTNSSTLLLLTVFVL